MNRKDQPTGKQPYTAPVAEQLLFAAEQGFAASDPTAEAEDMGYEKIDDWN